LWVIFALLDPDSGSTDPVESGYGSNPDPQLCCKTIFNQINQKEWHIAGKPLKKNLLKPSKKT
jgi:hypothetical protein